MGDFELDPDTLVDTFEGFDTLSLEETAMRAAEEREVRNLVENAGTKREITVDDFQIDAIRECIHRLRHAGFASRRLSYDELYGDVADAEAGAVIFASAAPIDDTTGAFDLAKQHLKRLSSISGAVSYGETYEIDGYLVEPMLHAPPGVVLAVDVAALAWVSAVGLLALYHRLRGRRRPPTLRVCVGCSRPGPNLCDGCSGVWP